MFDVAVVGAGFGGLSTALTLASGGARVVLFESLKYAGGCASTFTRGGARYEAGATLFSGFGEGQLFHRWMHEHRLPIRFEASEPLVELRAGSTTLQIGSERASLVRQLVQQSPAHEAQLTRFFEEQERIASALWALFDDPSLLPPFGVEALGRHLARTGAYLPLMRVVGRSLGNVVERHGLADCAPLRHYLDAVCQITVQASSVEAEAPFAMAAMDYYFRGTGHIHGGIGELTQALVNAIREKGGEVRFVDKVTEVSTSEPGFRLTSRRGITRARQIVLNLTPSDALRVLDRDLQGERLEPLAARVSEGWGAVMLYAQLSPDVPIRKDAHHLELVADVDRGFVEGNHIFVSISGEDEHKGPDGRRTVTISTHVRMSTLRGLSEEKQAQSIERIQQTMRDTLASKAPEVWRAVVHLMTGSPRTFARFVGREEGLVGGIPRLRGLAHYAQLGAFESSPGVHLVGDSVFPGQSTLATALGGVKTAERLLARLGSRRLGDVVPDPRHTLALGDASRKES